MTDLFADRIDDADHLTPRGRRTRQRLIDQARAVLEDVGYPAASVTEITERVGVSLGTFYRYFENKEQLFLLLLESLVGTLYESVLGTWDPDDPRGSLRRATQAYLACYRKNRKLIGAMRDMASSVPEAAALWWDLRRYTYQRMRISWADGGVQANPDLAISALGGMVEQFAYYWYVEGERFDRDPPEFEEAVETLSELWYRAVYGASVAP